MIDPMILRTLDSVGNQIYLRVELFMIDRDPLSLRPFERVTLYWSGYIDDCRIKGVGNL